jgi:Reverse transcriptase (RNA-dependent DNA polymerase)
MRSILDLSADEAKEYFLKGSSYFNADFPPYISFEPILNHVAEILQGQNYPCIQSSDPADLSDVNYSFVTNKDGRLAWRPIELIHPVIYVSLINLMCSDANWKTIKARLEDCKKGVVTCCSLPTISNEDQKDQAVQVKNWWREVEQKSLKLSLEFSHVLHTDVTDCYGSIYTHSIPWALHGLEESKKLKGKDGLLGDKIDLHIRAGRYGQTNGISQGSVLMDFIAELVLGYVDELISLKFKAPVDFQILRYRDDYRIFSNSDVQAEEILKVVSDALRTVGMRLGLAKTFMNVNVIQGSIKPDKLAAIDLQNLGTSNARTLQKQLLRLHSFGLRYPNSGALKKLMDGIFASVRKRKIQPDELEVQIAILTDIAFTSPATFPAIAGIMSHLISLTPKGEKEELWQKVCAKMSKMPNNGYQEVWLQRVTKPEDVGIEYSSAEKICRVVNNEKVDLWNSSWIASKKLKKALSALKIVVSDPAKASETMAQEEVALFTIGAYADS